MKRRANKDKRLKLLKARTELWLKTNLDNPFRDWDQHHSVKKGKAAMKAYTVAAKAIGADPKKLDRILRTFVGAFNAMEIDTPDREEIGDAFLELVGQAGGDEARYEELFDEWRDF